MDSRIKLKEPEDKWFSWFGGCGEVINCSGLKNILINDWDGTFMGTPTSIISRNEHIGP